MLPQILSLVLELVSMYKATRDREVAAGTVTADDGHVKTDAELADLFAQDAQTLANHAAAVRAKFAAAAAANS